MSGLCWDSAGDVVEFQALIVEVAHQALFADRAKRSRRDLDFDPAVFFRHEDALFLQVHVLPLFVAVARVRDVVGDIRLLSGGGALSGHGDLPTSKIEIRILVTFLAYLARLNGLHRTVIAAAGVWQLPVFMSISEDYACSHDRNAPRPRIETR